jgi:hypothetical protein
MIPSNEMREFDIVEVPDVEAPLARLCYKQAENMTRCDRKKGHNGLHTWEYAKIIADLNTQIRDLKK